MPTSGFRLQGWAYFAALLSSLVHAFERDCYGQVIFGVKQRSRLRLRLREGSALGTAYFEGHLADVALYFNVYTYKHVSIYIS